MKKLFSVMVLFCLLSVAANAQSKDEIAIRNLMETQRLSWNEGNLEKFMDTYWQTDSLMFIGKSGVTYGWQNTLQNYKKGRM